MEHIKWEATEDGGRIFVTMSDGSRLFLAEAIGEGRSARIVRARLIVNAVNAYDTLKDKAELAQKFVWLWNEMRSGYDAGITFKHMDKFEALVKQVEALT